MKPGEASFLSAGQFRLVSDSDWPQGKMRKSYYKDRAYGSCKRTDSGQTQNGGASSKYEDYPNNWELPGDRSLF
jgi:hypothetical protein